LRQITREHVHLALAVSTADETLSKMFTLLADYDSVLKEATSIDLSTDCDSSQLDELDELDKSPSTDYYCLRTDSASLLLDEPQQVKPQSGHYAIFDEIKQKNIQLALTLARRDDLISELTKLLMEYDILLTQGLFRRRDSKIVDGSQELLPGQKMILVPGLREPWTIKTRGLHAHGLYLLYNDKLSMNWYTFNLLLKEPVFTSRRLRGTGDCSPILSTHEYYRLLSLGSFRPEGTWIEDIWLCSTTDTLLAEAEQMWLDGDSQWAYEIAENISQDPSVLYNDRVRCKTFLSAILHFHEDTKRSSRKFRKIVNRYIYDGPEAEFNLGVLYFIEAKNLMALERYEDANLCFEITINFTPQYSAKARELQILCCPVDEITS
jgi:hypothetical protein